MKKKITYISTIIIILIGITSLIYINLNKSPLNVINSKEYNEIVEDGESKLVYVGRPTCPECAEFEPILEEVVEAEEVNVYYYNTDKAKKKSMDEFNEIKENLNIKYVPILIYYEGDKEVKRLDYEEYQSSNESLNELIAEYKEEANQ